MQHIIVDVLLIHVDVCTLPRSILMFYKCTSHTYHSLNFEMEDRYQKIPLLLPISFFLFLFVFLLFFFCRRVRYYVNCDSVVENGNENSPVEKRKSAGQRYVEWFLRTVESVRGACA